MKNTHVANETNIVFAWSGSRQENECNELSRLVLCTHMLRVEAQY